jgi:hypothetical protein
MSMIKAVMVGGPEDGREFQIAEGTEYLVVENIPRGVLGEFSDTDKVVCEVEMVSGDLAMVHWPGEEDETEEDEEEGDDVEAYLNKMIKEAGRDIEIRFGINRPGRFRDSIHLHFDKRPIHEFRIGDIDVT